MIIFWRNIILPENISSSSSNCNSLRFKRISIMADIENEPPIHEKTKNIWSKYENELMAKIQESLLNYKNTSAEEVKRQLLTVIDRDLRKFQKGITFSMVQSASPYGTRYQLINHTLYRQTDCLFPTRCEGIDHFLKKVTDLQDFEIIVNTRDYPQVSKLSTLQVPVFSFSKTNEFNDILYPAWSFWCGGPAITLFPAGIGRWDKLRTSLMNTANVWTWTKKKNVAFFRGSRTSNERDELIYLSRELPELVDAAYTKNQAWKSKKDTLNAEPAREVSFEDHCHYKYLFNFRGVAASFRFKHLFLCKSLVFHVGDDWEEFFYPLLKPWIHYVPIQSDYTKEDVRKLLNFFKEHDHIAKMIAENGYELIKEHLKPGKVKWYWKRLLEKYTRLQKFVPKLNPALKEVSPGI